MNFILIQGNRDRQGKAKHHMEAICSFKACCRFKPSDKNVQAANFKGEALKNPRNWEVYLAYINT